MLPLTSLACAVQERLGYFHLQYGTRDNDISVYMSAGGHHECVILGLKA
jgi:hypothetical protein